MAKTTKQTVETVHAELKAGIDKVIKDVEDLVATSKDAFTKLKAEADVSGIGNIVADSIVPFLPLPWYVPSWVARGVVKDAVDKAVAKAVKK